jgi:enoyl-CoA hydratase
MALDEIARVERAENGVVTVTIDRPPVNAPRFAHIAALGALFGELGMDAQVRCVILTATGERAFIAGTDVREFIDLTPETAERNTALVQLLRERLYEFPVPVICGVNGAALGLGLGVATSCDIRIASSKAIFGLPEIDVGVLGGSKSLARLVPQGTARLMMYTGQRIGAEEAWRVGLVEAVVAPGELLNECRRLADIIAAKFPVAIRLAKRGLNRTEDMSLKDGYAYECTLTAELRRHPEAAELAKSFFARKRH